METSFPAVEGSLSSQVVSCRLGSTRVCLWPDQEMNVPARVMFVPLPVLVNLLNSSPLRCRLASKYSNRVDNAKLPSVARLSPSIGTFCLKRRLLITGGDAINALNCSHG